MCGSFVLNMGKIRCFQRTAASRLSARLRSQAARSTAGKQRQANAFPVTNDVLAGRHCGPVAKGRIAAGIERADQPDRRDVGRDRDGRRHAAILRAAAGSLHRRIASRGGAREIAPRPAPSGSTTCSTKGSLPAKPMAARRRPRPGTQRPSRCRPQGRRSMHRRPRHGMLPARHVADCIAEYVDAGRSGPRLAGVRRRARTRASGPHNLFGGAASSARPPAAGVRKSL